MCKELEAYKAACELVERAEDVFAKAETECEDAFHTKNKAWREYDNAITEKRAAYILWLASKE